MSVIALDMEKAPVEIAVFPLEGQDLAMRSPVLTAQRKRG